MHVFSIKTLSFENDHWSFHFRAILCGCKALVRTLVRTDSGAILGPFKFQHRFFRSNVTPFRCKHCRVFLLATGEVMDCDFGHQSSTGFSTNTRSFQLFTFVLSVQVCRLLVPLSIPFDSNMALYFCFAAGEVMDSDTVRKLGFT